MELVEKEEKKRPSFDDYAVYAILGGVVSYPALIVYWTVLFLYWFGFKEDFFSCYFPITVAWLIFVVESLFSVGLYPFLLGAIGGLVGGRIKMNQRGAVVGGLVGGMLVMIIFADQLLSWWFGYY